MLGEEQSNRAFVGLKACPVRLVEHLPIHLFRLHLHKFQAFTLLRDPVARVLSLYRFLKLREWSELTRRIEHVNRIDVILYGNSRRERSTRKRRPSLVLA
jgi:hypothetical protein